MNTSEQAWPQSLARLQGSEIRRRREELGLKPAEVVLNLAELGLSMNRSTYVNLELGRRKAISVPEVFALALVLRIPPVRLLAPMGVEDLEVVRGDFIEPWNVVQWIRGDDILHGKGGSAIEEDTPERKAFDDLFTQEALLMWHRFNDSLQFDLQSLEQSPANVGKIDEKVFQLREWRNRIRESGVKPPRLWEATAARFPELVERGKDD